MVIDTVTWVFILLPKMWQKLRHRSLCSLLPKHSFWAYYYMWSLIATIRSLWSKWGVMVASHCHSWWRWCCGTSLRDTLIMTAVLSCSFWFCWSEHSSYLQSDPLGFFVQYHWLVIYVDILNFRSLYLLLWLADIPRLLLSTVQGQDLGALQGRSWLKFPPVFRQHFYS